MGSTISMIEPGGFYTAGPKKVALSAVSGFTHPAHLTMFVTPESPTILNDRDVLRFTDGKELFLQLQV